MLTKATTGDKMLKKLLELFKIDYQSTLDQYINSRNPKDVFEVEKLEQEFWRKLSLTQ